MTMLGFVSGGFLVATIGKAQSLLLDGASFLIFAFLLLFVTLPARAPRPEGETFWQSFTLRSAPAFTLGGDAPFSSSFDVAAACR